MKIVSVCALILVAGVVAWGCAQGAEPDPIVGKGGASTGGAAGSATGGAAGGTAQGGAAGSAGTTGGSAGTSGAAGTGGSGTGGAAGTGGSNVGGTGGSGGDCTPVINEVMTGSNVSASDEFVEIFNPCSSAAPMSGWRLVYRSSNGTADITLFKWDSGSIPAAGYSVIVGSAWSGDPMDGTFESGGLASAGGGVGLTDSGGTMIDSMGWGNASNSLVEGNAAPEPSEGSSAGRNPNGVDTDDNSTDFKEFTPPTPGKDNG